MLSMVGEMRCMVGWLVGLLPDEADCGCEGCLSVLMLASAVEWLAAAAAGTPEQPHHRPNAINYQMRRIGFKAPLLLSGINCIAAIHTHRWGLAVPAQGIASGRTQAFHKKVLRSYFY